MLADARRDARFAADPALRPDRPLSVAAVPLVMGGRASGLIYLENDLVPGAFSRARVKVLEMLGAHAAIAIANAHLYRELARREKELSDFLEAVPVGVFVTDPGGRPVYVNSAAKRLLGRSVSPGQDKEHLSETFQVYIDGTDELYPTERMPIVQALSGASATCRDMEVRAPNGRRLLGVTASPVKDETGQIRFAIAAFEDITVEQRAHKVLEDYSKTLEQDVKERTRAAERAQQAAEAANTAKSRFLASMSHELRTPMNAIIGFTRIVLRRSGDSLPNKQRENLDKVLTSANHLLALINDVLDLSKIEAGRMDLRTSDIALVPLATECVSIAESLAESRSQRLTVDARGEPFAFADADKVREILLNLIGNAVKFTPDGGRVTVRCYADGGSACLAVDDTGMGIAAESLEDVFTEFWQSRGGTSRQSGGTGLGLAISRRLAEMMGGRVSVASELGQGSTFTLTLPEGKPARGDTAPDRREGPAT
jgi:PAS domain S-box-containing protein